MVGQRMLGGRGGLATAAAAISFSLVALLAACSGAPTSAAPEAATPSSSPSPSPTPTPTLSVEEQAAQWARDQVASMSLDEQLRSLLMINLSDYPAADAGAMADAAGVGGLILMGSAIPDPDLNLAGSTPTLSGAATTEAEAPRLLAIDQEGGVISRLPSDAFGSALTLRAGDPAAVQAAFTDRAALLESLGITVNFGIVADVTPDPASFIYERSFGADGAQAAPLIAAAVTGEYGVVASTLKHFPGHGAAFGDSHVSVPSSAATLESWRANEALPFASGIAAGAELVMTGHLSFPAVDPLPASLSPAWISILRSELGFEGIVITDDMAMLENSGVAAYADRHTNAIAALAAGNDVLLYVAPVDVDALVAALAAAVEAGTISADQVTESAERVMTLRRLLAPTPAA